MPYTPRFYAKTAESICRRVVKCWQSRPFAWVNEADIQAEVAARLRDRLAELNLLEVPGFYRQAPEGWSRLQYWARVTCEGPIWLGRLFRPDIVLWSDLKKPEDPPRRSSIWPALWAL